MANNGYYILCYGRIQAFQVDTTANSSELNHKELKLAKLGVF